jgi:hypothetical protein
MPQTVEKSRRGYDRFVLDNPGAMGPRGENAVAIGSLDAVASRADRDVPSAMTEPHPIRSEGDAEAAPEFARVSEVLGPLEQIMLAADEEIGSIQQQVESETNEMSSKVEERIRGVALEQRARVLEVREALTSSATEMANRFDAVLKILDQAERHFAIQAGVESQPSGAGNGVGEVRVTVTERQRVTISGDPPEAPPPFAGDQPEAPPALAPPVPPPPPFIGSTPGDSPAEAQQGKGIRRFIRRITRRAA